MWGRRFRLQAQANGLRHLGAVTCARCTNLLRRFPGARSPGIAVPWSLPFFAPLLFLAAAVQTVKVDQFPLRSGCAESDPVVAKLHAGDPVLIKFSLAGGAQSCYVVSATVDGKTIEGNLPADALTGLEEFDRSRR